MKSDLEKEGICLVKRALHTYSGTQTHTLKYTHTHTLSLSHTHTLSLSHTHTHVHTHTDGQGGSSSAGRQHFSVRPALPTPYTNGEDLRVAMCCSVLQCVAVCCSVLQCVAVCCSVLQCVAV